VMAIFVGVFATALRPGSPTVAVEGAQAQIASLLTQARGVAVLKGAETRLIVNNNSDNRDRYLRFAGIVYWVDRDDDDVMDLDEWEPATDGITLPQGVYAYVEDPANMARAASGPGGTGAGFSIPYISSEDENYAYVQFEPNGTVRPIDGASPILAVSSGTPGDDGSLTDLNRNEDNIRGAIVRQYGSFVLLNDATAFSSGGD